MNTQSSEGTERNTDYLVIGGGSAGCVIASRLSEDPATDVTLIEAGPDDQSDEVSSGRFLTYNRPPYYWDLADERGPFGQPRILGGGSALNAMHAQRGAASDYDEWGQLGVKGWAYDDLVPYFEKVENDPAYSSSRGQVAVNRVAKREWSGLSKAIAKTLPQYGVPELDNMNTEQGDGFGSVPLTLRNGERVSSASAYLPHEVRRRSNLKILTGHSAKQLTFDGPRVTGAEITGPAGDFEIRAHETILCCGAILSPTLLLQSGIGPASELAAAGVAPKVDRPGVGKNLQNHPMLFVGAHLTRKGRQGRQAIHPCPFVVRYSSEEPSCPPTDMLLNVWERIPGRLAWDPAGNQIAILNIIINKAYSVGSVSLNPAAPLGIPAVKFNFLSDPRDLSRMVKSIHFLAKLLSEPDVRPTTDFAFAPVWKPIAITMMGHGAKAQLLSLVGSLGLSGPLALRRKLLSDMGVELAALARRDNSEIAEFIKTYMLPAYHVSGTCRMGPSSQKETVVDSTGAVVGVSGLRVADASIFPTLMRAGPNLPVMMAAEKIADSIRSAAKKVS